MTTERIVIITGANSGIGLAAAHRFAAEGDTVIMACRDRARGEVALEEVRRISGGGSHRVVLMELDVSSRDSICAFAEAFRTRYHRLDVLIHNAAYINHGEPYRLTPDGVEVTFGTNVIGPFLLTELLLDALRASRDARILHAGSNIIKHFFDPRTELGLDTLLRQPVDGTEPNVYVRYRRSKLALLLLTRAQARRLAPENVAVNYLVINGARMAPATIRKFTRGYRLVAHIQNLFFRPPCYMAERYFRITTAEQLRGVTGAVFNADPAPMEPGGGNELSALQQWKQVVGRTCYPPIADDRELQEQIQHLCRREVASPGVSTPDTATQRTATRGSSTLKRSSA